MEVLVPASTPIGLLVGHHFHSEGAVSDSSAGTGLAAASLLQAL